jgi:hypothetical protein
MSAKKRQTFDKMNRERAVRERRARKQEKKALRKLGMHDSNGDAAPVPGNVEEEAQPPAQ